jgi:phospholipase C
MPVFQKLYLVSSISLCLLAAGCGSGKSSTTPPPPSFQLTVTAPAANSGTVTSTPAGINCPGTCTASFATNTQVTLTATAATGYSFAGWSGGGCSGTGNCSVTLTSAMTVTPTFNAASTTYALTVTPPAVANSGTITSTPPGINCTGSTSSSDNSGQCVATFAKGTQVTLVAAAASGFAFTSWSGGGCSGTGNCVVTLNSAMTVTPTFTAATTYPLTVVLQPANSGTVTGTSGINCPGTCTANFPSGTSVTLTETPATGYIFVGWSGGCSGTGTTCSVTTVAGTTTVTPTFQSNATSYALTVSVLGSGTVTSTPAGINCTPTCSATFPANTPITLSETAAVNYTFAGWGGACTGTGSCIVTLSATASVTASFTPNTGSLQSINHILIFLQENRSFDHYFGYMRQYWANNRTLYPDQQFDGLPQFNPTTGIPPLYGPPPEVPGCDPTKSSTTTCVATSTDTAHLVPSFHAQSVCSEALSPFWNEAHVDWDIDNTIGTGPFKGNGWVQAAANDARQVTPQLHDVNGYRGMEYFTDSDLNYYYFMASNFATSDRWFAPIMSRTQLNREFLLAATTGGHVYPLAPPYGALTNTTIFQALQKAGITWKIYVNSTGTTCADTDSSCLLDHSYINMFTYYSTIKNSPTLLANIASITQLKTDMANGSLPQVALIEPPSNAGLDEHPTDSDTVGAIDIQSGAKFTAGLMDALMASPNWKDSAMIFTYDEPGGFYDHVAPQLATPPDPSTSSTYLPIDLQPNDICKGQLGGPPGTCNFAYTGYRVPLIVVSPFSKKNYVSHTVYDHTAILKLIEKRFNLPALTARDAAQADMSTDFFDFANVPWATPPTAPTQNTGGTCNLDVPIP